MQSKIHLIEDLLDKTTFPKVNRKGLSDNKQSQILTLGNIHRPFHGYCELKANKDHPELMKELIELCHLIDPNHVFSTITINKNVQCKPHIDRYNKGETIIIGLGRYEGGELVIEHTPFDIRHKPQYFNGARFTHWTKDWVGDRYSIMFYRSRNSDPINK